MGDPRSCSYLAHVRISSFSVSGLSFSLKSILLLPRLPLEFQSSSSLCPEELSCFLQILADDRAARSLKNMGELKEFSRIAATVFAVAHGHCRVRSLWFLLSLLFKGGPGLSGARQGSPTSPCYLSRDSILNTLSSLLRE